MKVYVLSSICFIHGVMQYSMVFGCYQDKETAMAAVATHVQNQSKFWPDMAVETRGSDIMKTTTLKSNDGRGCDMEIHYQVQRVTME